MPPFLKKKTIPYSMYGFVVVITFLLIIVAKLNIFVGLIALIILVALAYFLYEDERMKQRETEQYITTLSHRVKKVGEEALLQMPIGIMLISEDYVIEWTNSFLGSSFFEETLVGKSLYDVADPLIPMIKKETDVDVISIFERKFKVYYKKEERLLYFFDITEQKEIEELYESERTVIAIIYLDNYDELTQGMDDQTRSGLNSFVTSILNTWALDAGVYLKRTSSDRFIAVFNEEILHALEKNKFMLLDEVREKVSKQNVPLTLSIGIGAGISSLPGLGKLAQSSLDLALGRGGDQVAIKQPNGKVKFFGGKTNPIEKRTRVRARVISHALRELIIEREKVIIMGHKRPDMDAIGSAIGIKKMAELNNREAYIVIDRQDVDKSVQRLMVEVGNNKELDKRFITPEEALELSTDDTLLVVVDTHKPGLVIEERLIERIEHVVVIDHHRRSEDFIENPLLVYMEPYASSTAELVTELLEYQPKGGKLNRLEATALLAGIIVDTKSFTLRTGSRTFDAASYLRTQGADTVLVQKLLKEDLETYIKRAKIIETVQFPYEGIAIAKGHQEEMYDQVFIAQAGDTLLTIDEISASFVISNRSDGKIGISARSLGAINVQVIMEKLGGGGHLTNAATQLIDTTIEEAEITLRKAIDEFLEGSN